MHTTEANPEAIVDVELQTLAVKLMAIANKDVVVSAKIELLGAKIRELAMILEAKMKIVLILVEAEVAEA